MRRSLSLVLILAGATLVAACASQQRPPMRRGMGPPPGGPAGMMRGGGLFVSPAGEPFRRSEAAAQPMRAWFDGADADHDGAITRAEFEADFLRWFALLDADHDGEIAPAEVARYEQEILPEMQSRVGPGGGGMGMRRGMGRDGPGGGGRRRDLQARGGGRARGGMGAMAMMSGAARFGLLPVAHPVMDADTDFNRGVTRAEFAQAAARRFALLDGAHDGRLTLPALVQTRMQAFGARRRDGPGPGEDEVAPPPPPPGG